MSEYQGRRRAAEPAAERKRRVSPRWLGLLAVLIWFVIGGVGGPLVGRLAEVQKNDNASFLPESAESTEVANAITKFSSTNEIPYLVVMESAGQAAAAEDQVAATTFVEAVPTLPLPKLGSGKTVGDYLAGPVSPPIPSQDGTALLAIVNLDSAKADDTINGTTPLFETAEALRLSAAQVFEGSSIKAYVGGPGGLLADLVTAFGGIDGILLAVALGVVLVILLIVYRSSILPFAVLISAVFGLALAASVIFPLAKHDVIDLSGQSQGILSILVVGAATDYALLMVSRFREALHDHITAWDAIRVAWRGAFPPIMASGLTVILGLLCLTLSDLGSTSGLGPVGALGIAGAMATALTFLPGVLLLAGRRVFWPAIPRVDHVHAEDKLGKHGIWGRVARMVGQHPRRTWVTTAVCLAIAAAFLPTFKADGISADQLFLTKVESVTANEALARHFPGGAGSPVQILVPEAKATEVMTALKAEKGVADVYGIAPGAPPKAVEGVALVQATLTDEADSPAALEVVKRVRADLHGIDDTIKVGGGTATSLDVRDATNRDLRVIIPAILLVIFVVLAVLLRSLIAPLILVLANVLSFAATIGVAALVFNHVFDFPNSDPATPLYAFVFLVALGIDYSIFLMTRVREETPARGTRQAILVGLAVTGGVITSAGIVLAATFSALGILPLLFLAQIAFLVAFGVLLDTLVVRSLLVPALGYDIGARIWAPSALSNAD
ncbi:MAG: MMPL family transporter [Tetrasphaera jenkinsii]|jgi:RND superfamily putative drug exporter|nr:MMPL family transporter [Tetrasphaera jenkinsii]